MTSFYYSYKVPPRSSGRFQLSVQSLESGPRVEVVLQLRGRRLVGCGPLQSER